MRYQLSSKIKNQIKISKKHEISLLVFKYIQNNFNFPIPFRQKALLLRSRYNKNFNFSRVINYCLETGKTRFILKNLKISRMSLKNFSSTYFLTGYYKVS